VLVEIAGSQVALAQGLAGQIWIDFSDRAIQPAGSPPGVLAIGRG
jgi:hypothetical protein